MLLTDATEFLYCRRVFKPDVKIIRPPNASARPRSRAHDKEKDHLSERSVMAHEELRQLNHKKLQFLLKQETRNSETVRCGLLAVPHTRRKQCRMSCRARMSKTGRRFDLFDCAPIPFVAHPGAHSPLDPNLPPSLAFTRVVAGTLESLLPIPFDGFP